MVDNRKQAAPDKTFERTDPARAPSLSEEQVSKLRAEHAKKALRPVIRYEEETEGEAAGVPLPVSEPGYIESFFPAPEREIRTREDQLEAAIELASRAEKRQRARWICALVSIAVFVIILAIMLPVVLSR